MTQIDMADRLAETQSFVSKCERGERRIDVAELRAFCRALLVFLCRHSFSVLNRRLRFPPNQ